MGQEISSQEKEKDHSTLSKKFSSSTGSLLLKRSGSIRKSSDNLKDQPEEIIPDDATLTKLVDNVIKDLGLPDDKAAVIRDLSPDKKWMLLKQHKTTLSILKTNASNPDVKGNDEGLKTSEQYVEALKQKQVNTKDLVSLEVALRTLAISWVGQFISLNGLSCLLTFLKGLCIKLQVDATEKEQLTQCIRCLKTLMNNAVGLSAMVNYPNGISILSLGLCCSNIKMKAVVLDMLGAVTQIPPNGYLLVLQAMEFYRVNKFEKYRFQTIVSQLTVDDLDYQMSCMAFLNALVSSPDEADARVAIRNELLDLGLMDVLAGVKESSTPDLLLQITVFEEEAISDYEEIFSDVEHIHDSNNLDEVFALIKQSASEPESHQWLTVVFNKLLVMSTSATQRNQYYWKLISEFVTEVILQKHRIRLDYHNLNTNLNDLIAAFATEESFKIQSDELEQTKQQMSLFSKDMESVQVLLVKRDQELKVQTELAKTLQADLLAAQHQNGLLAKKVEDMRQQGVGLSKDFSLDLLSLQPPAELNITSAIAQFYQDNINSKIAELKKPKVNNRIRAESNASKLSDRPQSSVNPDALADSSAGPPPPPIMAGPPPPPPPGMMAAAPQKSRLLVQPKTKMRQLQWDKMAANSLDGTLWQSIHDDPILMKQLNYEELESVFGIQQNEKKVQSPTSPTKKVINLLDAKKSYNMSIMLSRIKMSFPELRLAIISMSEDVLSEAFVRQLLLYIPSTEESAMLADNLQSYDMLGKPEQFYIEIMKITRYQQRLEGLLFKRHFADRASQLHSSLTALHKAAQEVVQSPKLHRLLEIILLIGNFMNNTSFKGNAYGFQIDMLSKLADVRTNGKGSFLTYLDTLVSKKFLELQTFYEELSAVEKASRYSLQQVAADFNELTKGLESLVQEVELHKDPSDRNDKFYVVMQTFLDVHMGEFTELQLLMDQANDSVALALKHYGQDSKVSTEQFFGTFHQFVISFDKAHKENIMDEELARKAVELQTLELKRKEERRKKQDNILQDTSKRGVMDDLISSLKNGDQMMKRSVNRRAENRASRFIQKRDSVMGQAELLLEQLREQYE